MKLFSTHQSNKLVHPNFRRAPLVDWEGSSISQTQQRSIKKKLRYSLGS